MWRVNLIGFVSSSIPATFSVNTYARKYFPISNFLKTVVLFATHVLKLPFTKEIIVFHFTIDHEKLKRS